MRRTILLAIVFAACGSGGHDFEGAAETCSSRFDVEDPFITVDEAGLYIDGAGEGSTGANLECIVSILTFLEVPNSIITRMDSTTALMGVQEANYEGMTLSWTYHPENGLDISITEEDG